MHRLFAILLTAIFFLISAGPSSAAELIGHWGFDQVSGAAVRDLSGQGHDGKVFGATPIAGVHGGALKFDGRDDYVALGELGELPVVTIAFWMNADRPELKDDWQGLISTDGPWEKGALHFGLRSGSIEAFLNLGDRDRGHITHPRLRAHGWYHVALVIDVPQRVMRLFLNGMEEETSSLPESTPPVKLSRQVIGREDAGKAPGRYFAGAIGDVRIYRGALTETEVRGICPQAVPYSAADPRNIRNGSEIPDEGYCDQPYVVITRDGNWLCTMTTGPGREGQPGQHIIATISSDRGRTWTKPIDIEPSGQREASWVVPLVTPYGRVYAFYTYNADNFRVKDGKTVRADTIGWYAFKYSDDNGRTWCRETHRLPMRVTACDRGNDFQGKLQLFWGIDKPNTVDGAVVFSFTKLGKYFMSLGEGWMWRSDNVLDERDVSKLHWELLPDGENGLRVPEFGSTQEEHNVVPLSGRSLYCVYRTALGFPVHCYSRDGGHTWTVPEKMTYTPGGRVVQTPRACPMVWRTAEGRYLFWFHNNPGKGTSGSARNPVWITGGQEKDGHLHWSQPEILLYDSNLSRGMSYPDLIQQDGRYWFTETQKRIARVHEADRTLLEGLWTQGQVKTVAREGLLVEAGPAQLQTGPIKLAEPLSLRRSGGMSLEVWIEPRDLAPGQVVLDGRTSDGKGMSLATTEQGTLRLELADGQNTVAWDCDPGLLSPGKLHHVAAIVDAGPGVIRFVVDGVLCDGGEARPCGWTRYAGELDDVSGSRVLRIAPSWNGQIKKVRIYGRALRTSEAVAAFHCGA